MTGTKLNRLLAALAMALPALAVPPASAETEITFATEGTYPPWSETDAEGTLTGFDVDLVEALCMRLDMMCRLETATYPAMVDELVAGAFNAIISGIAITAERDETIAFTRPYMSYSASFAIPHGSSLAADPPTTVADTLSRLEEVRIGAQDATVNAAFVHRILPGATLVTFGDQQSLDKAIADRTVDAGLAATETWRDYAPGSLVTLGPALTSAEYPLLGRGLGIGLAKDETALKESLDSAICAMTDDQTIAALSVKWFGHNLSVPCN